MADNTLNLQVGRRREERTSFSEYWFNKKLADLDHEEYKSYRRAYRWFVKTGEIKAPEKVAYSDMTKSKKFCTGTKTRQTIRCSCNRQIITMFNGVLLDVHKSTKLHKKHLGERPEISTISLIDLQWDIDDADLMDNIIVKKTPTTDYALPEKRS